MFQRCVTVVLAGLTATLSAGRVSQHSPTIVVRGRVVDSASHPLRDAQVRLVDGGWAAFSDSSGAFVLRALRPIGPRLQLTVTLFSYERLTVDKPLRPDSVQTIGVLMLQGGGAIPVDDFQIRGSPPDTSDLRKRTSKKP